MGYFLGMVIISPLPLAKGPLDTKSDPHSSLCKKRRRLSTAPVDHTYHRAFSIFHTSPMEYLGSNPVGCPGRDRLSNIVTGHFNTNVGNVANSFNTNINTHISVGVDQESFWIQTWLSPLEPHKRHDYVSRQRQDGIGDWVIGKSEFESWSKGQDGAVNPTLLCYGDPGVGKTYIR